MQDCASESLRGMLEAEGAFAARARTSVRSAFLDFLSEDSLVLAPGPTPGRAHYAAEQDRTGLAWYPSIADVAQGGDLGFTSGPWVFEAGGKRVHGHFLTVWRRDGDCRWRAVVDGGVSHAAPAQPEARLDSGSAAAARPAATSAAATPAMLPSDAASAAMRDFAVAARDAGVDAAIRTYGRDSGFLLLVDAAAPMGWGEANEYWKGRARLGEWREKAAGHAQDSTLAYAVGEAIGTGKERFAYVQVWQFDPAVANLGLRVLLMSRLEG